ncbi:MAG: aconitate hydratase [Spirochaetaceae bacterium]|nr:MAG: aconitate hydratase [Spirochaetaceae bacterium]
MGLTLSEKIIAQHLVSGTMMAGEEIAIRIDQTLTQDATGTLVYLQFAAMGIPRVRTELSVSYVDHNTSQEDFKNMDDHRFLQSSAKKYGAYFSPPGNGICHQVHLERFGIPGKTLLGSDSHTPTGGGIGMLSIGAGGLDVAAAMAGAPFYLVMPQIVGVKLTGALKHMCSAKDVILTLLKMETVKGGVGKIYEYFGPGVKSLSVPERATITNMGAELGATTSIFPSDEVTKYFLMVEERENHWQAMAADKDTKYSRVIEINLEDIVPMAASPHSPDNVVPVTEIAGTKVDQIVIGSCTNSSINDIGVAADILYGKRIHERVQLGIAPGSRQVILSAGEAGIINRLVGAGARILESACGPCIGMGFAPCSEGISVRTFNRNFKGRSGTKDASVYLVSPETAAVAALAGEFADPRTAKHVKKKDYFRFIKVDDKLVIPPDQIETDTQVIYGPNIKPVPLGEPVAVSIEASVIIKTGDNITTDQIMPAGAKILPLRSNIPEISKHVFEQVDVKFYDRAQAAAAGVIIGGDNYGQGSSREHAALAPMYLSIKAVIAKSFARIHKANLVNFGIIPFEFANPADYDNIAEGDVLVFPDVRDRLSKGQPITVRNQTRKMEFGVNLTIGGRFLKILLEGGLLNAVKSGK